MIIRTAQPPSGSRLRVLVVEDEPLLAFGLLDELAMMGHEGVGPVMAGRDVMAVREERRIDFAIVDINLLDGRTGIDVGRYLKVHGIPYAFLTASPEALPPDLAGAIAVVAKPCTAEELKCALKYLFDITLGAEGNNCPSVGSAAAASCDGTGPKSHFSGTGLMKVRESRLNGKRILVLEADRATLDRLQRGLQSCGAAVLGPTGSAVAALQLIYAELPDGALLDASLDAQTSFAVAELLWREAVPFVFFASGAALVMPPEFLGRSLSREGSAADIAGALFGWSTDTHRNALGVIARPFS